MPLKDQEEEEEEEKEEEEIAFIHIPNLELTDVHPIAIVIGTVGAYTILAYLFKAQVKVRGI